LIMPITNAFSPGRGNLNGIIRETSQHISRWLKTKNSTFRQ
jgi:hypothetical protein